MGVCGMRNSPLVRTALLPSFSNGVKSLFAGFQSRIKCFSYVSSFCQAKEGERQRSTPPQEPPIGRAASIRTCPLSRKPQHSAVMHRFLASGHVCCRTRSVSRSGIARRRWGVIHSSGGPQEVRKDRFHRLCPDLICLHGWVESVFCVHHPVEHPSFAVGQFVVNIQISNLLTISQLRQTAVDPVDEGNERHIVVPREDPHYYDCRLGGLLFNHMQNRLKTSCNVVCSRADFT